MIPRHELDQILQQFMQGIMTSRVRSPEEANVITDCLAIEILTAYQELAEEFKQRRPKELEKTELELRNRFLAVTAVSDAVKQIVSTEDVGLRGFIYQTLVDLVVTEPKKD